MELQQCYKAQSRVSEQLVVEIAESRTLKSVVQEKETAVDDLQKELTAMRLLIFLFMFLIPIVMYLYFFQVTAFCL
jgi:hypothetical protein